MGREIELAVPVIGSSNSRPPKTPTIDQCEVVHLPDATTCAQPVTINLPNDKGGLTVYVLGGLTKIEALAGQIASALSAPDALARAELILAESQARRNADAG